MDQIIVQGEARVNITWAGQNGDLPDPVHYDSADGDVKQWVTEAVRTGSVPGINADADADFTDFVVDRFAATAARPYNLIQVRPKTPFGESCDVRGCGEARFIGPVCRAHFAEFQVSTFPGDVREWIKSKG